MADKLIERLNGLRPIGHITGNSDYELINPDGPEAAQAIAALTAERDALREHITEQSVLAQNRINDGHELGAPVWRIALEDIISENAAALSTPLDRETGIREYLGNPSEEMIEAVCAARYFMPEQWPDGCTDGEIAVQRLLAEKQIAAILALIEQETPNDPS